jgi:hypothetical protein
MTAETDRALLRRFEPVLRFTHGEKFFPMDLSGYVEKCSLWMQQPNQLPVCLVPAGQLTLDRLGDYHTLGDDTVHFLKFTEPANLRDLAAHLLREGVASSGFHAGPGRLARVGYSSRFVDALFNLTLLARGRVPGDAALAATMTFNQMMKESEVSRYYGRVVRQNGWIALQYWFFYAFNDWRSGFYGANDHEADWEMVYVYLYEGDDGALHPEWVAYTSHDYAGDDLRRRWDDPELEKVGEHPVVYVGAGSHAGYYQRGEYLTELEIPILKPVVGFIDNLQMFVERNILYRNAGTPRQSRWSADSVFRVPFIEYARGDGVSIGAGGSRAWAEPGLLDLSLPWVSQYRGLWGLYTKDPFSGEDAPAGPMFNRDGSVRQSWYAPLGWAGLDKVTLPNRRGEHVEQQRQALARHRRGLEEQIAEQREVLLGLNIEREAMRNQSHMRLRTGDHDQRIQAVSRTLNSLKAELSADKALEQSLQQYARQIDAGVREPARAHLRRAHQPVSPEGLRTGRLVEAWAAISIGLMMVGFVLLLLFARQYLAGGLIALISLFVLVEATFRGRVNRLINSVTVVLATVAGLLLLVRFFQAIVVIGVLVAGSYIMWQNIRELRR